MAHPHDRLLERPASRRLHHVLSGAVIAMAVTAGAGLPQHAAHAADAAGSMQKHYRIAPGPLSPALSTFAGSSGVNLSAPAEITAGLATPGLEGSYSVEEGFARLLSGTGLQAQHQGGGDYLLRRLPAAQTPRSAPEVSTLSQIDVVESAYAQSGLGPVNGYVAKRSSAGTKTDTPLIEIPHSVSVVTRQQLDDQKPSSLLEALEYTPGVFTGQVGATNRYDYVAMRGFIETSTDNSVLDGLKVLSDPGGYSSMQVEPYLLERIDVFRGPASVLFGRNAPGGLVAMTSKQPLFAPYKQAEITLGTHNRKQAGFDVAGPVDDDGRMAFRVTAMGRTTETQFDHVKEERMAIAPSLLMNFSDRTKLLLQAYLQHDPNGGYHGGVPADATLTTGRNGQRISRHFFEGDPDLNVFRRTQRLLSYQLEHAFNDNWKFRQNGRYLSSDVTLKQLYAYGWAGPTSLTRYYSGANEDLNAFTIDNQLQGEFTTGPLAHTLLLGMDYQHRKLMGYWESGGAAPIDVNRPQYGGAAITDYFRADVNRRLEQTGFYLQDQIALDKWRFTLSGRQDNASTSNLVYGGTDKSTWRGSKFTKRAGAVYLFDNGVSPYASYSESFNPSGFTDTQGRVLPPTESKQYEIGVKYQPPGSNSLLSAAVYDLTQDNVATRLLGTPSYAPAGKVRSRGVELEARSQLSNRLSVTAGYTLTDIEFVRGDAGQQGKTPYQAPRQMVSLWGDYKFDSGIGMGAGVRYVGKSWADNDNTMQVPAYTLLDLSLRMDLAMLNPAYKGASLRINARNLLDKTYVASCASLNYCYYGEARNVMATLSYKW